MSPSRVGEPKAFIDGAIAGVVFRPLAAHVDPRGWLIEVFRQDELPQPYWPVMAYVSQTEPGESRGPHEHRQQADLFAFLGPGDFTLYLWDVRDGSATWGHRVKALVGESNRQSVLVPPGVVHAYRNTGGKPGWVLDLPNRLYAGEGRREAVDEIRHEDHAETVFVMD